MKTHLNAEWVRQHLPRRTRGSHKGSYGTLAIVAGSRRYRGAAALAAEGALRTGAGIVQLLAIEPVCAVVAARLPCCTFVPLAENARGTIEPEGFSLAPNAGQTAVLAGCGMGATAGTAALTEKLLLTAGVPLILDADALNVLAGHLETGDDWETRQHFHKLLDEAAAPVVLTPHIGEMARLSGIPAEHIAPEQASVALDYALAHRCIVVLKSHITVVATPEGDTYINDRAGNPGLAKGGSGDVLAGIIASLAAQRLPPDIAAAAGVWLHAAAGDEAADLYGEAGLSPADLPLALGTVFHGLGR